jgi:hypothetical protein
MGVQDSSRIQTGESLDKFPLARVPGGARCAILYMFDKNIRSEKNSYAGSGSF